MLKFYRLWPIFLIFLISARGDGTDKKEPDDIESLRNAIKSAKIDSTPRVKSQQQISDVNLLKENLLNSPASTKLSESLVKLLEEGEKDKSINILKMQASEAIIDPSINVIDNHLQEIINPNAVEFFKPNIEEIKEFTRKKHSESPIHNLFRENLKIQSIHEEIDFKFGTDVTQWKTLAISEKEIALIGKTKSNIILIMNAAGKYEIAQTIEMSAASDAIDTYIEVLQVWDGVLNKIRNLVLIAVNKELVWYELSDGELKEVRRWQIRKKIDKVSYFQHDTSDLIMLTTIDDADRVEVEFIEFNFISDDFWVVQTFKLPNLPTSIICLEAGRDLLVVFTQSTHITVYRHQNTKFERGKFSFFKAINAVNASVISGFRIGGHSYLAIGGDKPQILRYVNGDFIPQTILSQTFGHVEEFLPIPIKIYRDDLVLLVQHRIKFRTHSLAVVDALIWNGLAFESSLSIPCQISADPNANGFTCMLDIEREEGLLGSAAIVRESNSFYIIIPRHEAHSGLFRIKYEIVEAEDPLIREMEQIKKSIELINGMLDIEESVKKAVKEALDVAVNPKNDFHFENLTLSEIYTEILQFDGNVLVQSDQIEFLDEVYDREDFLVDLDEIEKTLAEDEQKIKKIDQELNQLIRTNRQATITPVVLNSSADSPIYYLGPFTYNGQLNSKTLRVLPKDNPRTRRQISPIKEKRASSLTANNLIVETINGIPVSEFVFLEDGKLSVPDKDIIFEDSIEAENVIMANDGKVNKIDLSRDVLTIHSAPTTLAFQEIFVDELDVAKINNFSVDTESLTNLNVNFDDNLPILETKRANIRNNLNVETINGLDWNEFMSNLILEHLPSNIDNLTINGNIWIAGNSGDLQIEKLNTLSFPDEYVLKSGKRETLITGRKKFLNTLATNAIDTSGSVNNLDTTKMITLDQPQLIPTKTTFDVLEVLKKLEVNGTIAGRNLDNFMPNPTLEMTNEVLSACTFRELTVEGPVKIENTLNDKDLAAILADVVYEDEGEVLIKSQKTFNNLEVSGDINIANGFINDVQIENILTSNTEQVVSLKELAGDVYFSKLKLSGLFDGINATELEMNSIRTFGDQFIQTPLVIGKNYRIDANEFDVEKTLNTVAVQNFCLVNEEINLLPSTGVTFNGLIIQNGKINGDIVGNGAMMNLDLKYIEQNHFSKTLKQNIRAPVEIESLTTKEIFSGLLINNIDFDVFKNYMRGIKNYKNLMLSGQQKIENLIVDGNVHVQSINDRDFNQLKNNVIWLNRPNVVESHLKFLDSITTDKLIIEGMMNKKNFQHWRQNWISKNENPIKIDAEKTVKGDVFVEESLIAPVINKIKYENILRKRDVLDLSALNIIGSVNVEKLDVRSTLNGEPIHKLLDIYSYDKETGFHTVNSNLHLHYPTSIAYLKAPRINEFDVNNWLSDLIKVDENNVYVKAGKTFKGQILAENGIYIDTFNSLNTNDMMKNMVIIYNNETTNIYSNILFESDFQGDIVALRGSLSTDYIDKYNLREWMKSAISINKDLNYNGELYIFGQSLNVENLYAERLNGYPLSDLITLYTNQSINYKISVNNTAEIQYPLIVQHSVNGLNLALERNNTVMRFDTSQIVNTELELLSGARILKTLTTSGHVNSKKIENIVLLNSSPKIDARLNFASLEVNSLHSDYHLSGINLNKWLNNVLWKNGKEEQIIIGNWNVKKMHMDEDVSGNGLINKKPIHEIEKNLNNNVNAIEMTISDYSNQYSELCHKMQERANRFATNSIYLLKYFELAFEIKFPDDIFSYFAFKTSKDEHYLLININCTTHIHKWNREEEKFIEKGSAQTGVIYSYVKVEPHENQLHNGVYIITYSKMAANVPCAFGGVNTWKLDEEKLIHIKTISNEADVVEIFENYQNSIGFYALEHSDRVINYDVFGTVLEQWKLPTENYTYSFLPHGILPGLNIFNGRKIFSLESKFLKRSRRFLFDNSPVMKEMKSKSKKGESTIFTYKMPEFERKHSIPTIPQRELKKVDFMTRIRQVGDVIKSSFNSQPDTAKKLTDSRAASKNMTTGNTFIIIKYPKVSKVNEGSLLKDHDTSQSPLKLSLGEKLKQLGKGIKQGALVGETNKLNIPSNKSEENSELDESVTATESTTKPEAFSFTPRIILPSDDRDYDTIVESVPSENNETAAPTVDTSERENENYVDTVIVQGDGVRDTENFYIPERGYGEIIVLYVGAPHQRRSLYAVSRKRNSIIKGYDVIEIFRDVIEGVVFQYIQCKDPSNILAVHFRDETLLVFMEGRKEVQIFIYRGIEGFIPFRNIQLNSPAQHMSALTLPPKISYKCDHYYLVLQIDNELRFVEMQIAGNCGNHVQCDKN